MATVKGKIRVAWGNKRAVLDGKPIGVGFISDDQSLEVSMEVEDAIVVRDALANAITAYTPTPTVEELATRLTAQLKAVVETIHAIEHVGGAAGFRSTQGLEDEIRALWLGYEDEAE